MSTWLQVFTLIFFLTSGTSAFSAQDEELLPTSLPIPDRSSMPRFLKVALLVDVPSAEFSAAGPYRIRNVSDGSVVTFWEGIEKGAAEVDEKGIRIGLKQFEASDLLLSSAAGAIRIGKRYYGDRIRITRNSRDLLTVVNEIGIEEYLKGVLPLEADPKWPIEALKAQAVISRTFALFKAVEKRDQDFMLRDSVSSQVYGGALFHHDAADDAVWAVRDEVLTSGGKLFPAYFHAACGGRTAEADQIWKVEPNPVLKSVLCPFCKDSLHYEWSLELPLSEVEAAMQKNGFPAKHLKHILFQDRDDSGRARKVELRYEKSEVTISAGDFRAFLGYDRLKSLKAAAEVKEDKAYFKGYGWGHGIGFCQWGAKAQAEAGKTYREILEFYYPGSEVKRV